MRSVTIQKPVVDLKATGAQIKSLRIKYGFSVHDIQTIFGFEYPQAVYAWDRERRLQAGKMLKWSILSESPSSYAAKACVAWGDGAKRKGGTADGSLLPERPTKLIKFCFTDFVL